MRRNASRFDEPGRRTRVAGGMLVVWMLIGLPVVARAAEGPVTFARDVAPILQEKCQVCHRTGEMAPMPLTTYQETRPWARAIKERVVAREMPPWYLDKTLGIQEYKNDISLNDEQIALIVQWVDSGAPLGDPASLPLPKQFPDTDRWQFADQFGDPDLIVKAPSWVMPADSQDQWWEPVVETGLTEDRWVRAVEVRPSKTGRQIVHHAVVHSTEHVRATELGEYALAEFSLGAYGELYKEGTGKHLTAGTKVRFDIHYHAVGREVEDQTSLGVYFYPVGYQPRHEVRHVPVGLTGIGGRSGSAGIDIPPHSIVRHDAFMTLQQAARIENFKPHMHYRGKSMSMEAIYPDGLTEMLSAVDRFNFNWHVNYIYADEVAPVLPRGTVLHIVSWHDNTAANRGNPDPNQWVGRGSRSIDEMTHAHMNITYLSDADYQEILAQRQRASRETAGQE